MKKTVKNQLYLIIFCALIGGFAGTIIWVFLKVMAEGMALIWKWIPQNLAIPNFIYTLLVCTLGGTMIGLFRKKYGNYPEELQVVLGKVKSEKHYEYRNMLVLLVAALLPLLIGSSVGPEAGLTGIIVALCYWAGDNLKFAHKNTKEYSEIGMAVTLSVLFHAPLFGIFAVEESDGEEEVLSLTKTSKIIIYGIALAAGTGCYMLLSDLFGSGLGAAPSFPAAKAERMDFLLMIIYIIAGCIMAKFYHITHKGCHRVANRIPPVFREMAGGLCLGIAGCLIPVIMFSGEEEMGILMTEYGSYFPWMLVGIACLKILLTNICIQSGLKGGHFFPVIFAGVCLGYGIAMFVFPDCTGHVVFAAAIVTASLLGGIMKKPLAVTMLLFLCFPIKMFVWIFVAAALGSKSFIIEKKKIKEDVL